MTVKELISYLMAYKGDEEVALLSDVEGNIVAGVEAVFSDPDDPKRRVFLQPTEGEPWDSIIEDDSRG